MNDRPPDCKTANRKRGITRRGLLAGASAGMIAGAAFGWMGRQYWSQFQSPFQARTQEVPSPPFAMPGPYPGRVVEIRHPGAVNDRNEIHDPTVSTMMARGMCDLTGADHVSEAWRRLFERDDVVGIKVNPVGYARGGAVPCISSPAVLVEVVNGLRSVGIPPRNIIVFERYATDFRGAGYDVLMRSRPLQDVRWYVSSAVYTQTQVAIDGHDNIRERDPKVVGYDPDVFVSMGFAHNEHDRRDDRRYRSHLSAIVTRMVNKFITIPCLKDHRSAGVTLALKNMSHGLNNNVARSHLSGLYHLGGVQSGPNQCNTFIPTATAQDVIRRKATLHILDGLIGAYEGGPGSWNGSWATWRRKSLFFATDPVAMDMVCWEIIDNKRREEGWQPVAHMGLLNQTSGRQLPPRLARLTALGPEAAAGALAEYQRQVTARPDEPFDRRQPEHVILAGTLGLGEWTAQRIEHRQRWLSL